MPIGGILSYHDGESIQQNLPYVDGMVWNTSQLSPGDVIGGTFLLDVSGTAGDMNVGPMINIGGGSV